MSDALAFGVALAVATAATPASLILARRTGVLAPANPDVATHTRPKPLLGGLGIFVGAAAGCAAVGTRPGDATLIAIALMTMLGLWKDLRQDPFSPWSQLAVQTLACGVLAVAHFPAAPIAAAGTTLLGILIVNCVNLLDVMDGLAGTVATLIALGLAALAGGATGMMALALAGGVCGFLCWNRPAAAVFMGDIGSLGIGFALFAFALCAHGEGVPASALAVLFAVPALDFTATIGRRLWIGRPPMLGDGSHPSLRLLDTALGPWRILALYAVATGLSGIAALAIARGA